MRFAREAAPFVWPLVLSSVVLASLGWRAAGVVVLALALGTLLFFRIPNRSSDAAAGHVLSAASGKITAVDEIDDPEGADGRVLRIVTFLSVFDVHVQRSPVPGVVAASVFRPGRKMAAFRKDVDRVNESHLTVLQTAGGDRVGVRQIAGLVARRVVPYLGEEDVVARGDLLGVIKFGSRVDVTLPLSYEPRVAPGDRVVEGSTVIAVPRTSA